MDGEWEPPVIQNPEYKGEWKPRQIDNPDYKGTWIHPEVDNPEYSPDSNIYAYENFAVLGLDLWQVRHRGNRRILRGPQVLRVT
nr:calreticulin [Rousettus aegyptiacus]